MHRFLMLAVYPLILTFSRMTLKNGQTHFKNLSLWTTQNFQSMFGHFSTPRMKGLKTLPLLRVHLFST